MHSLQDKIEKYSHKNGLSDIHIHAGYAPTVRVNGDIKVLSEAIISKREIEIFSAEYLSRDLLHQWHRDKCLDTDIEIKEQRFRANFYFSFGRPAIALRRIAKQVPTIDSLFMPEIVKTCLSEHSGLILVSGATGSGKSTSLAAMANYVLEMKPLHLLTIEDPIEFRLSAAHSLVSQRQIGTDAACFVSAIRAGLREDPDVIVIGEMRDRETIELVLATAELGHLVMATTHASGSVASLERVVNAFPTHAREYICSQMAACLKLVISQRLLKCCDNNSRIAAYEVLVATDAVKNLVRENKLFHVQSVIETSRSQGMLTMDNAIARLRSKGLLAERES